MKNKIYSLNTFHITKKELSKTNPKIDIFINIKYPKISLLTKYKYKKRPKIARKITLKKYNKLHDLIHQLKGEIIGKKSFSIHAKIKYLDLKKIKRLSFVDYISIREISGVKKKKTKLEKQFYTIVSKVRIEVEGTKKKSNDIELRITTIKAKSIESAKKKTKLDYKKYAKPYLNTDGRIVIWKFIRVLDIYETGIFKSSDFNNKEGVELYSKFVRPKKLMKFLA